MFVGSRIYKEMKKRRLYADLEILDFYDGQKRNC